MIKRPTAVFSHQQPHVTTLLLKHTANSSARPTQTCCLTHKIPALQSASDSNVLRKTRRPTLWMNRLTTNGVNSDAKLYNSGCFVSGSHKNKNGTLQSKVSLLCDKTAYHQRKCQSLTIDRDKANSRENHHVIIDECDNIFESLTNMPDSGCKSSTKTSMCKRLLRDRHNQCRNKPANSGFLGQIQSAKDEEFLESLRKAYNRLQKARSGSLSSLVGRRKMARSGARTSCDTGDLCVVGQSLISSSETSLSTASNLQARKMSIRQLTGRDCRNEVNGISLQSQPLAHMLHQQGLFCDISENSDQNAAAGAPAVIDSDKKNVHMPSADFQLCRAHLTQEWSPGKIAIQLSFHSYLF